MRRAVNATLSGSHSMSQHHLGCGSLERMQMVAAPLAADSIAQLTQGALRDPGLCCSTLSAFFNSGNNFMSIVFSNTTAISGRKWRE